MSGQEIHALAHRPKPHEPIQSRRLTGRARPHISTSARWHSYVMSATCLSDRCFLVTSCARRADEEPMAKLKFRPLHDRVVVKRIDAEEKASGGIIIPDSAQEKPSQGEIIAVGPGARDEAGRINKLDVKAGDRVLFGKWSGTEVKLDGDELLIMKESDIMGIIA